MNMTSSDIKAKEGDLASLLCSAQGEPPVTFNWEKDQKPLKSFMVEENFHRSSLLVVKVKDQKSFGEYTCHIRDRFGSRGHTIVIKKSTGNTALDDVRFIIIFHKRFVKQNLMMNTKDFRNGLNI